jgi:hypothetical protein
MGETIYRIARTALAGGRIVLGLTRSLFTHSPDNAEPDNRQMYDTDLIGDYNHRTGRLDAGNDPYGWYDED